MLTIKKRKLKKFKRNKNLKVYKNLNFVKKNDYFNIKKFKKGKVIKKLHFRSQQLRIINSIILRRTAVMRRLYKINKQSFETIASRYNSFAWIKDRKLIWGLNKYRHYLYNLESQGMKRKVIRRRLKIYAIALKDKKKLKNYYYGMKEYILKRIVREVFFYKTNSLKIFVYLLESQLQAFLIRTNVFRTINQIRIFLKLGLIKLNGKIIKNLRVFLNPGDIVSFDFKNNKNKDIFIKKISLFYYPSKYIEVSFSLFKFLYYRRPNYSDIWYPFTINLSRVLSYYRYKGFK